MKKEVSNRGFIILQYKEPYREWAVKWNDLGSADLESHLRCSRIYMIDFVGPDDVANMCLFLTSEMGKFISGQAIGLDGHTEGLSNNI
jgi:hypothetical protein